MDQRKKAKGVKKGAWSQEEDRLLRRCMEKHGEGNWSHVPALAGLRRCRKSCRLRWVNYLKPTIRRGEFMEDETDLIIRLHRLLGNRWSLIAGRVPGRTANDIKNYWNTHLRKQVDWDKEINVNRSNKNTKRKSNGCNDMIRSSGTKPSNIIKAIKPKAWVWKPRQPRTLPQQQGNNDLVITTQVTGETAAAATTFSDTCYNSRTGAAANREVMDHKAEEAVLSFWAKALLEDNVDGEGSIPTSTGSIKELGPPTSPCALDDYNHAAVQGSILEWDDFFSDEDIKRFLGQDC